MYGVSFAIEKKEICCTRNEDVEYFCRYIPCSAFVFLVQQKELCDSNHRHVYNCKLIKDESERLWVTLGTVWGMFTAIFNGRVRV